MKLKLTINQVEALELLLKVYLSFEPRSILNALLHELMNKLFERLRAKCQKMRAKHKAEMSMTLNDIEAMALYCWYRNIRSYMDEESLKYEIGVADMIFNQIDKHYA